MTLLHDTPRESPIAFIPGPVPLEQIIITDELQARPSRQPDHKTEAAALCSISKALAQTPQAALQELVDQALKLCRAESAGISIAETDGEKEFLRWQVVSGRLASRVNSTFPLRFSPSGEVMERQSAVLMKRMSEHYSYADNLEVPLSEILIVPLLRNGKAIGTVWAIAHSQDRHFDAEDKRLLECLAGFATGIAQAYFHSRDLEQSLENLNHERELREQFVATLTHDMRTPLTSARMSAQLMTRKSFDPEGVMRASGRIISAMDRAEKMIRDLLDSNRIKAGEGIPLKTQEVRLDELVGRVVEDLNTINQSRLQFENGAGPIVGQWDSEAIQRVLENLATNAVKYGEPKTPITVGLRLGSDLVELSVHNKGNPIPEAEQKTLFNFYKRSDSAIASNIKGWGIGLTLVKGIAEAHSGTVDLKSNECDGTTFYVRLPVRDSKSTLSS